MHWFENPSSTWPRGYSTKRSSTTNASAPPRRSNLLVGRASCPCAVLGNIRHGQDARATAYQCMPREREEWTDPTDAPPFPPLRPLPADDGPLDGAVAVPSMNSSRTRSSPL